MLCNLKKGILIGIVCLVIATALELAGPLIAKKMIDEHIVGIEGTWNLVAKGGRSLHRFISR
ncbi:hypothetical protein RWE15_18020 [Virgibacillus halophilus]|uniref:Uncharacterized protein n=1 Tax=Tigheibacillus halophilus TaxID=361280 RepID=A0ABU5CBA2_9BACI|nr:hypothetical protein [Virgibacillus halophilus]